MTEIVEKETVKFCCQEHEDNIRVRGWNTLLLIARNAGSGYCKSGLDFELQLRKRRSGVVKRMGKKSFLILSKLM